MIEAEEAAELVADGMTLEELVAKHGGVIDYGVWVPDGSPWAADDGNYTEYYDSAKHTEEQAAHAYAAEYDPPESTQWFDIEVWKDGVDSDGELARAFISTHTVRRDPVEPKCIDGEHAWDNPYHLFGGLKENPGVWGSGCGVLCNEACSKCGAYRTTDTGAQHNGQQGLSRVSYSPPDERSLYWLAKERVDCDEDLEKYRDILLADWGETAHYEWVRDEDKQELIDWAADIQRRNLEDKE